MKVRKLFEPWLYPSAPVLSVFDAHFGSDRPLWSGVCAVGFEPNPKHAPRLRLLQETYAQCGKRVYFFTEVSSVILIIPGLSWSFRVDSSNTSL